MKGKEMEIQNSFHNCLDLTKDVKIILNLLRFQ